MRFPATLQSFSTAAGERLTWCGRSITLPEAMRQCLALEPQIAQAAEEHAIGKRYWAIVGNGWNRVAAEEIRIKLSELCYKSIACDATEDKKHIDLFFGAVDPRLRGWPGRLDGC